MIYLLASAQFFLATLELHPRPVVPVPYVVQMSAGVSVFVEFAVHRRFRTKFDVAKVLLFLVLAILNHDEAVKYLLKTLAICLLTCLLHCVFVFQDLKMIHSLKDPERAESIAAAVEAVVVSIFRMVHWLHARTHQATTQQVQSKPSTTASTPMVFVPSTFSFSPIGLSSLRPRRCPLFASISTPSISVNAPTVLSPIAPPAPPFTPQVSSPTVPSPFCSPTPFVISHPRPASASRMSSAQTPLSVTTEPKIVPQSPKPFATTNPIHQVITTPAPPPLVVDPPVEESQVTFTPADHPAIATTPQRARLHVAPSLLSVTTEPETLPQPPEPSATTNPIHQVVTTPAPPALVVDPPVDESQVTLTPDEPPAVATTPLRARLSVEPAALLTSPDHPSSPAAFDDTELHQSADAPASPHSTVPHTTRPRRRRATRPLRQSTFQAPPAAYTTRSGRVVRPPDRFMFGPTSPAASAVYTTRSGRRVTPPSSFTYDSSWVHRY